MISGTGRRTRSDAAPRDPLLERVRGATRGAFELRSCLGRGRTAVVYHAHDVRLDRAVVLKIVLPDILTANGVGERIKSAARTAMALDHPNIAATYSFEELDGLLVLVTSLVEGASLEAILRFEPTLAIPAVQSVLEQVATALDYAHEEGVIHGGVKPSNVIVNLNGDAIVTDFGLAQALNARGASGAASFTFSPTYLSPEQIRGAPVYASSDQYALGVVAYEMLVGTPPFTGTMADVRSAHLGTKPAAVANPELDIPPEIASAVMRMLAKAPSERYPSLGDAIVDLAQGMSEYEDSPRGPLSWLAQQNMPRESEGAGGTAPRGWRGIPLTPLPLPLVEATPTVALPPLERALLQPVRSEPEVTYAPAAAATPALVRSVGATLPVPSTSSGAPARAPTPREAQRAALAKANARRRKRYTTVGVAAVTIGGLAAWQTLAGRTRLSTVAVAVAPAELAAPAPDTNTAPAAAQTPAFAIPKAPTPKPAPAKALAATIAAATRPAQAPPKAASPSRPVARDPVSPPPTVTSLTISGERRELVTGETMRLQARVTDSENQTRQGAAISWRSSNSDIAEVDASGLVVAKRRGSVRITASVESRSDELQLEVRDAEVVAAPPPATVSAPAPRVEAPRPPPRLTEGEAERVARSVADRLRGNDIDGLASAMAGSKADRDFVAWLKKKPLDLQVGATQVGGVALQPDGSARVTYSVPISWTHASGARPVRTAAFSVVVGSAGSGARVSSWSLASPFVP